MQYLAALALVLIPIAAHADIEVPKSQHNNWHLSPVAMTIVRGQVCKMLQDGHSDTHTRNRVADRLMDTEGLSRKSANRVAVITIARSNDCRSIVITSRSK